MIKFNFINNIKQLYLVLDSNTQLFVTLESNVIILPFYYCDVV